MRKINVFLLTNLVILTGCTSLDKNIPINKQEQYHLLKGMNYSRKENYSKGLRECEKAYKINKKDKIVLKEMGRTYSKLENYDKGIYYYEKALEVDSKDRESIRNLSYLYFIKGNYKKSLCFIKELAKENKDYETRKFLSYLLYENKKYKEAYISFERVLQEEAEFDKIYCGAYKDILIKLGKQDELKLFLEEQLKNYSTDEEVVVFYSNGMGRNFGRYDLGERELKRYIASYGGSDSLYLALAEAFYGIGDKKEAEKILTLVSSNRRYDENKIELKERLRKRI